MINVPHDKALHIIAGVGIFAATHWLLGDAAMLPVIAYAVGKEIYDSKQPGNRFDPADAVATLFGGVLGVLCGI